MLTNELKAKIHEKCDRFGKLTCKSITDIDNGKLTYIKIYTKDSDRKELEQFLFDLIEYITVYGGVIKEFQKIWESSGDSLGCSICATS